MGRLDCSSPQLDGSSPQLDASSPQLDGSSSKLIAYMSAVRNPFWPAPFGVSSEDSCLARNPCQMPSTAFLKKKRRLTMWPFRHTNLSGPLRHQCPGNKFMLGPLRLAVAGMLDASPRHGPVGPGQSLIEPLYKQKLKALSASWYLKLH